MLAAAQQMFREMDVDGDGSVDRKEFVDWWERTVEQKNKMKKTVNLPPSASPRLLTRHASRDSVRSGDRETRRAQTIAEREAREAKRAEDKSVKSARLSEPENPYVVSPQAIYRCL